MMDFLFGTIQNAQGFRSNQAHLYAAEDIVMGSFQFENGILGIGNWCFTTSAVSNKEVTTIIGSKGQISFPFFGDNTVTLEIEGKEKEVMNFDMPKHIQQPLIQTIVNELHGMGNCPSTGISGARTNRIMALLTAQ